MSMAEPGSHLCCKAYTHPLHRCFLKEGQRKGEGSEPSWVPNAGTASVLPTFPIRCLQPHCKADPITLTSQTRMRMSDCCEISGSLKLAVSDTGDLCTSPSALTDTLWPSCPLPPSPCSPPISPTRLLTHRLQGDKNQGQELDWSLGRQHTEGAWEG